MVHEAFALADGVDDVQGGGLGDVLLNELEVQGLAEVVRVHELPHGITDLADVGDVPMKKVPSLDDALVLRDEHAVRVQPPGKVVRVLVLHVQL